MMAVGGSGLIAGGASAADPVALAPIELAEDRCRTVGYVDAYFGGGFGREFPPTSPTDQIRWNDVAYGGAGRAAIQCAPQFSIQLDAWADHWSGNYGYYDDAGLYSGPYYFERTTMGVGTHLTLHRGNLLAGVLASIGTVANEGTFGNIGAEAAFNTTRLMAEGQVGYTTALFGPAAGFDARDWYAQVRGTFYPTANMSVGANVGVDFYSDATVWLRRTLSWGAKLEFSPAAMPIAFYVGYEGWHSGGGFDANYDVAYEWEHAFRVGLRLMVGERTLRDLDRAVGLIDDNAIYGPAFGPTHFTFAN
jgi:hypothetical protein